MPASASFPALTAQSRRRFFPGQLLGGATLVVTWLFLWSWITFGVLAPLERLPWGAEPPAAVAQRS